MGAGRVACFVVAWIAFSLEALFASEDPQPIVQTQYGRLRGTVSTTLYSANPVYVFRGIAYARPPVGELRLAVAQPVAPWEGVMDATLPGNMCPQKIKTHEAAFAPLRFGVFNQSEGCLYLDVYTPDVAGKRTVLVHIHGGGFQFGSGSGHNGTPLAAIGDIVVVSINYRLGLLGFLPNYAGGWPSNLGIRDQQFALRWVQDNIAAFGGDPHRVTITGQSAGATSVAGHVLSPSSEGLFHRAIMQSGTVFPWNTGRPEAATEHTLRSLGCAELDGDTTLACIRNKSIEEIMQAPPIPYLQMDGEIFFEDSLQRLASGKLARVDLLAGVTGDEGYVFVGFVIPELNSAEPDTEKAEQQLKGYLSVLLPNSATEIQDQIMEYYFGGNMSHLTAGEIKQKAARIFGVLTMTAPTFLHAQHQSDHVNNVYFYEFEYEGSFMKNYRPTWHTKCDHGFDIVFTSGALLAKDFSLLEGAEMSKEDVAMAKLAVKYWSNFVKTGDPNGEGLVEWKPFTRQEENYLILKPQCEQASHFYPEEMEFWNKKIRYLGTSGGATSDGPIIYFFLLLFLFSSFCFLFE